VILYANRQFAEILKTPLEKVIGSTIHTWIAPADQKILQSLLRKGANEKCREQLVLAASDGTLVPIFLSVSNLLINEMPDSFCLVVTDLTEQKRSDAIGASEKLARELLAAANQSRLALLSVIEDQKQAEEEILRLNAELEQRVEERTRELRAAQEQLVRQERLATLGQVAGSIGHELRNPLGVISNAVYYLKISQPEASDKVKEYLDILEKETRASDKIITDLLDFTRIKPLDREPAAVSELIHQTLKRYPAPRAVQVALEIPAGLPRVYADPQHVMQVLGNLVVNAYQAMERQAPLGGTSPLREQAGSTGTLANRKLTVSAAAQGDMMILAVQDTGSGILPENMNKLFEPLFTTKARGIGLGLAVSKKLVEANGGRIEVQSDPGKGSVFTIYLPIHKEL
jgi:signal transduction histidine kinase